MTTYYPRLIDPFLEEWKNNPGHKPLLLRGARQVGKSSAVRHLALKFENFVEINFEKNPVYKDIFKKDLDPERIVREISLLSDKKIENKKTLLFLDEIQESPEAIMSLRFFKEDLPDLHVVAAGSLLEFALENISTYGVGRIHSMFMYPMTFDEFLLANSMTKLIEERNRANVSQPLPDYLHNKIVDLFRTYLLTGGLPEVVDNWIKYHDYIKCQQIQDDLIISYETDFAKYKKRIDPILLQNILMSVTLQLSHKFGFSKVKGDYTSTKVKEGIDLLKKAGLVSLVYKTSANGLPLASESSVNEFKVMYFDPGLALRILNMSMGYNSRDIVEGILLSSVTDLVNKGAMTEMVAGLEMMRYKSPNIRHDSFYWERDVRNSSAEVDYIEAFNGKVLPIEVKAGVQGGMKSLWMFMNQKKVSLGVRTSLENFGKIEREDEINKEVVICPLYVLSQLNRVISNC